ncbi:MAG: sigma-70 family RNA polymerase sigma factor [Rhodospirillales bacterium]|nr:sigma-70 family RNA polymerase sigma factor [Rhodospirillales bacterium]MDE2319791.1 sigma-70 family RNA polymerase sigma factor [Rhodospirillales bacterium]
MIHRTWRRVYGEVNVPDPPLLHPTPRRKWAPRVTALNTPPPDADTLACMISRVAETRDRQAYAALFKHFAPRVKAYLRRGGMDAGEAEELTQEVMLNIWRKAGYFDAARGGAATWVFAIVRNARIDHARRRRDARLTGQPPPEEADLAPSAESIALTTEREAHLRCALNSLGPEQKQIVQLSFFSDTPHTAIANALNLPLGTVKSRVRLAMAKLRVLLEEMP